ncbi:MAG: TIGR04255 family protein [Saprospiraceae bacterium]|nr:TIGR04255 family protein [Saprospiraceae bacterium]
MEPLPTKISPERLRDTVIELKYDSDIPAEYILGLVYDAVEDVLAPVNKQGSNELSFNPFSSIIINPRKDLFQNEFIRLQVIEGRLIFNSNGVYKGWIQYKEEIKKTLDLLSGKNLIKSINRIGLRYISEFSELQIFDKLIWNFHYTWKQSLNLNTSFRTEWEDNGDMIIVNLANSALPHGETFSIIDIDVNYKFQEPIALGETVLDTIERLHHKEKEVFFGLMRRDFLLSLNPTY